MNTRVPICQGCHSQINGPYVLGLNSTWCPDHFKCASPSCGRSLLDCGYVEEEGRLYCENDYELYFSTKCGKCSLPVIGDCIKALNKDFHPQCFTCAQCRRPISKGNFHIEEGKTFCEQDWRALYQPTCSACEHPVKPRDRWVEALGENYHSQCFNCWTCQETLEGRPFFTKRGRIFCKSHSGRV